MLMIWIWLKRTVDVLHTLSTSVLGEGIGLVCVY